LAEAEENRNAYDLTESELSNLYNDSGMASTGGEWSPPIDSADRLNDKIISSSNKHRVVHLSTPKYKIAKVGLPLLDEEGQIVYSNGFPVIKKIKKLKLLDGWEQHELNFPIPDWFNDSITSAFLTDKEARFVRELDDLAFALFIETIENPGIDWTPIINELYWVKASMADTSKGTTGEAVRSAKTTITKGETINREYRDELDKFDDYKKKKKHGLLGLGWWIF